MLRNVIQFWYRPAVNSSDSSCGNWRLICK